MSLGDDGKQFFKGSCFPPAIIMSTASDHSVQVTVLIAVCVTAAADAIIGIIQVSGISPSTAKEHLHDFFT
jgi:hypothetical protein